jgi:hypothetical protein
MQSFGLEFNQVQKVGAIELEIAEARASALGITGRRLEAALTEYLRHRQAGAATKKLGQLTARISNSLQELLIQRESMGLSFGNLQWVLRTYDIPQEILSKLGLRNEPGHLFRA